MVRLLFEKHVLFIYFLIISMFYLFGSKEMVNVMVLLEVKQIVQ
jgi:hypothetical protein